MLDKFMQMKNNPKKFSLKESVSCHLKLYIKKKRQDVFEMSRISQS